MTFKAKTFFRYMRIIDALDVAPHFKTANDIRKVLEGDGDSLCVDQVRRILNSFETELDLLTKKLESKQGRNSTGYAWDKRKGRPRFGTPDPHQALTLQLAAELLDPVLPGPFLKDIKDDVKRARKVLGQVGPAIKRLPSKIKVIPRGRGRLPATVDRAVLQTVYDAVLDEKRISVSYISRAGKEQHWAQHELNPLGLAFRFDTFYLVHVREPKSKREDPELVMEWPLHRFRTVKKLDTRIRKPLGFDLDRHLENPVFTHNLFHEKIYKLGSEFKIKLKFNERTARYVLERPFSDDQTYKTQPDGRVLITATVKNSLDLLSEIRSFANDVEVISPKPMRDYFRDLSQSLYAFYCEKPATPRYRSLTTSNAIGPTKNLTR